MDKKVRSMHSTSTSPSLLEAFARGAQAAGARVSVVGDIEEVAEIIATADVPSTSGRYTATSALLAAYSSIRDTLSAKGIELRVAEEVGAQADADTPSGQAAALQGDVGLLLATAGVAETGSFLSAESTLPARLLGMLSDSVFVILEARDIVPGLVEMGAILSGSQAAGMRYLSLITGPSRTADIERVLTIGVQGPKVAHILTHLTQQGEQVGVDGGHQRQPASLANRYCSLEQSG
jgi:L-lactate dehydrogenase complex protein LldG